MKTALVLAVAIVILSSLPLTARRGGAEGPATTPFATSRSLGNPEGTQPVVAALLHRLDAGAARRGDTVLATTQQDARTLDGTLIPQGTRLIGHVGAVHPRSAAHADSSMSIAFDQADLESGVRVRIRSVIRAIAPAGSFEWARTARRAAASGVAPGLVSAPHPGAAAGETAVPGILLAGASGTLSSPGGNVSLASGTRLILSVSTAN